jgi:general L-amino acid transport system permease protein
MVGIVLATVLGTLLGVGRFSRNAARARPVLRLCRVFRNVPVLLQLLMWYLHADRGAAGIAGRAAPLAGLFFLSKGGLSTRCRCGRRATGAR